MEFGQTSPVKKNLVIGIVAIGVGSLAVGAYVLLKRRAQAQGGSADKPMSDAVVTWCQLRRDWAKKVDPMGSDILLKGIRDAQAAEQLRTQRNTLCQQYAKQVRKLSSALADPRVLAVEKALISEGKVRANVSVELSNLENQLAGEQSEPLRKAKRELQGRMKTRIADGQRQSDTEVSAALTAAACAGAYRGPMTDAATADNPYVSWGELDFRRKQLVKRAKQRVASLEPQEQLTNRVYHTLMSRYRAPLKKCYAVARRKNPGVSSEMGLRVRLTQAGKVRSVAVEWWEVSEEGKFLNCLMTKVSAWRLPRPFKANDYVVVKLDFAAI